MLKLLFKNQRMLLAHINARSEKHGEEREPAADIKLQASMPNDVLDIFHPKLKAALYHFDESRSDLADKGKQGEAGYLPHLTFDNLAPLKLSDEMLGAKCTIRVSRSPVVFENVKINAIQLDPQDGGTVDITIRVQGHPDEEQFGKLYGHQQKEVSVTIEEGEAPASGTDLASPA